MDEEKLKRAIRDGIIEAFSIITAALFILTIIIYVVDKLD